jgi:hypothetical protein
MGKFSETLADRLIKKGFSPAEIPELIDDLVSLFRRGEKHTSTDLNQELETLGWGLDLLDESLFQEILSDWVGTDELFK